MTMPDDADVMRGLDHTYAAVAGLLDDDTQATGRALCNLTDMGMGFLFSACGMWAAMFNEAVLSLPCSCGHKRTAEEADDGEDTFVGVQFISAHTGRSVNPEEMPSEMKPAIWATRFITATANGDAVAMHALFSAIANDAELLGNSMVQLVKMAAGAVARLRSAT